MTWEAAAADDPSLKGTLTVICGPMFSNKSGELLRLASVHRIAGMSVGLFKHSLDNRYAGISHISTHGGQQMPAEPVSTSAELELAASGYEVVGIDEAQFFDHGMVTVVRRLIEAGVTVIAAGLDRDFRGDPFGPMPELLSLADNVLKLRAVCMVCRSMDATMTQRLIDGEPAGRDSPLILVGAEDGYQARCRNCHRLS